MPAKATEDSELNRCIKAVLAAVQAMNDGSHGGGVSRSALHRLRASRPGNMPTHELVVVDFREDGTTDPHAGEQGRMLSNILKAMSFPPGSVVALAAGPGGADQVSGALEQIRPRCAVVFGPAAAELLLDNPPGPGKWGKRGGLNVMVSLGLGGLVESGNTSDKRVLWEHMLAVLEKLDLSPTPAQVRFFTKDQPPAR